MRKRIQQGTNRSINAANIVDANGAALIVTGWSVLAVARANHVKGTVLAVWSTAPTGMQAQATALGRTISLPVTPAMSSAWDCDRVAVQAYMTSPDGTQRERIISEVFDLDREAAAS